MSVSGNVSKMPNHPLLEAFFWLEPVREDVTKPFNNVRALWQYPDSNNVAVPYLKTMIDYCYPDLHSLSLENVQEGTSDHLMFTFTAADGAMYYVFVYRYLFRGVSRRFDVSRRVRHALCIVSRFPYYSFFRNMLIDIYSFGLLESFPRQSKAFTDHMFNFMLSHEGYTIFNIHHATHLPKHLLHGLITPEYAWVLPTASKCHYKDATLLPLLQILGVDRFFKLLTALLCERPVIFVADKVHTLVDGVLSAAAMLHPFRWPHLLATVLPRSQFSILRERKPYLVGVLRTPIQELVRLTIGSAVVIDLDAGELRCDLPIRDIVGDAGNTLKQATESLDRVRAGVASVFLGKADTLDLKDIMISIVQDLKSVLASKPGTGSLQSMTSGLLRGLPGTSKTTNEARLLWTLESEKTVVDCLTSLFIFLLGDVDEFVMDQPATASRPASQPSVNAKMASSAFPQSNEITARQCIQWRPFIERKKAIGVSGLLCEFLEEFSTTRILKLFLDEKVYASKATAQATPGRGSSRLSRSVSTSLSASMEVGASAYQDADELYDFVADDLRIRQQVAYNAPYVRDLVNARSMLGLTESGYVNNGKLPTLTVHWPTMQFTSAAGSTDSEVLNNFIDFADDFGLLSLNVNASRRSLSSAASAQSVKLVEQILKDSYTHESIGRIFETISYRLEMCKAADCKGLSAVSGLKALQLMQILLVQGPMQTVAFGLELIPLLRKLLRFGEGKRKLNVGSGSTTSSLASGSGTATSGTVAGSSTSGSSSTAVGLKLDNITNSSASSSSAINFKPLVAATLSLLVDHRKLITQRTMITLTNNANHACLKRIQYSLPNTNNFNGGAFSKSFGQKRDLFPANSSGARVFPSFKRLHQVFNETRRAPMMTGVVRLTTPEKMVSEREEDDDVGTPSTVNGTRRSTRSESAATNRSSQQEDLLDFSSTDKARFRVVNQDTGDVFDIREVEEHYEQLIPTSPPPKPVKLAPPPPPSSSSAGTARSRRAAGAGAGAVATNNSNSSNGSYSPTESATNGQQGFATAPAASQFTQPHDPWAMNHDPFVTTSASSSFVAASGSSTSAKQSYLADLSSISADRASPLPNNGLSGGAPLRLHTPPVSAGNAQWNQSMPPARPNLSMPTNMSQQSAGRPVDPFADLVNLKK